MAVIIKIKPEIHLATPIEAACHGEEYYSFI
jgi:hypothetical protein